MRVLLGLIRGKYMKRWIMGAMFRRLAFAGVLASATGGLAVVAEGARASAPTFRPPLTGAQQVCQNAYGGTFSINPTILGYRCTVPSGVTTGPRTLAPAAAQCEHVTKGGSFIPFRSSRSYTCLL